MEKQKKTEKKIRQIHIWVRAAIQLVCFIFFSSAFTAAFGGIKYIATQLGATEKIEWTAFVAVLVGLCGYTILFGRFFCGFACAFGSLGDAVHTCYQKICKKCKKKPITLDRKLCEGLSVVKYLILAALVILCFLGNTPSLRGTSPWDVFSMLHAGNFGLKTYIPGLVLLLLIVVGMAVKERFFCRFLCPMGAVFSLLPVIPVFSLRRNREVCLKGCSGCTRKCPSSLELPADGSYETAGDCFQCQKCVDICPKGNIHCSIEEIRGSEVVFTVIRAGLLVALYLWVGL